MVNREIRIRQHSLSKSNLNLAMFGAATFSSRPAAKKVHFLARAVARTFLIQVHFIDNDVIYVIRYDLLSYDFIEARYSDFNQVFEGCKELLACGSSYWHLPVTAHRKCDNS